MIDNKVYNESETVYGRLTKLKKSQLFGDCIVAGDDHTHADVTVP